MPHLRRALPLLWSVVLAGLLLGPALKPGFVLSYDMVWVPDLALRPDFWGLGSGLPRAVPSDAVVAILDELLPGMVLQKLVLVGALVLGGIGATRLTDRTSLPAQLVALTLYQWNPFVAERLLIGHWPVLVGYAALPWVIEGSRTWRETGRLPTRLWFLLPLASLSASAGLMTAVAVAVFAGTRAPRRALRRLGAIAALLLAANAPWVVAGLLHASSALTDPDGARFFALRGEGSLPGPLAALGLGGIWNAEVVPNSRGGPLAWVSLIFMVALVAVGFGEWARRTGRRDTLAYAVCWAVGWGLGVLTWALPDLMAWLVGHVPGAGLLRDGSRLLSLCVPLLAAAGGYGAARVVCRLNKVARPAIVVALVLLPVATMSDASFGMSGRLTAVQYPDDLARARVAIDRAVGAGATGDVLLLPLSSYRQPAWNGGHKVLDPVGRYLAPDFVAGDDLYVSGRRIRGEDPRVREAARALGLPTAAARSAGLAELGIGFVATERDAGTAPEVQGTVLLRSEDLFVQRLSKALVKAPPLSWVAAMVAAWLAFVGLFVGGLASGVVSAVCGAWNRRRGSAYK